MKREAVDQDADELPDPWELAHAALRGELEERGQKVDQERARTRTFRAYADETPEPRGPLNFREMAFQEELYSEAAIYDQEQVFRKATQVGVSTQGVRVALFHADVLQHTVLYTFPTQKELSEFSRQRMKPVVRASAHLRRRMTGETIDTVDQKQLGADGWVYFRGTNKPIDSIPADVVIFDEYDTSDQANIEASESRVTGVQSAGIIRRVGVPSIPGFGIDALYEGSDQRVWMVKCELCGHHNPIAGWEAFDQNVDQDAVALVCAPCRRRIDVRVGEWVPHHPDRDVKGYAIPKLLVPGRKTLARVIANSRKTRPDQIEAFYQRDLGEAYAPAEGRLSLEAVQACVRPDLRPLEGLQSDRLVTMGVDVASARALNVTIEEAISEETGRKVFVGTVEDEPGGLSAFQRLCWLMQAFGVNMAGIDNEPDGRFSQAFAGRFPGRVYRCDFFTPQPGARKEAPDWNVDDAEQFVSLYRTRFYDAVFERYRMQNVLLPPLETLPWDRAKDRSEFATHLGNLNRRVTELPGESGRSRVDYVKTGHHDYAQCEAYNLAAIELYWRNSGIAAASSHGPISLADQIEDFAPVDLSGFDTDDYRPGFQ